MCKHFAVVCLTLIGPLVNCSQANPRHCALPVVQKIVAQEIHVAPLIVTVPVVTQAIAVQNYGVPHYYTANQAYTTNQAQVSQRDQLRSIIREELRGYLTAPPQQPPAQQPIQQPPGQQPVQQPPANPQMPYALTIDDVTPADLQTKIIAAYQGKANCVNCHGAGGKASGNKGREFRLVLADEQGGLHLAKQNAARRWQIYGMASSGAMPPAAAQDASKAMEVKYLQDLLLYASQKDPDE